MTGDRHLSLKQEQFLRELFELCDRYHNAEIMCCSHGTEIEKSESILIIQIELRLEVDAALHNEGSDR